MVCEPAHPQAGAGPVLNSGRQITGFC